MANQFAASALNAAVDAIYADIGASPVLEIRTGAPPATPAAADTGTLLCAINLPAAWLGAAVDGRREKIGTWEGTGLPAAGTGTQAGHFRLKQGATTKLQGTVTHSAGDGGLKLVNLSISEGQPVPVQDYEISVAPV
ncbi:MAG: hypothetical protein ACK4KW_14230 [Gemmobacter sp.]